MLDENTKKHDKTGKPDKPLREWHAPKVKEETMVRVSPVKLEMLVTIVAKKKADFYTDLIQSFDVNMQIKVLAKGAASSDIIDLLGLTQTDKIAIFSMIRADRRDEIMDALEEKFKTIKNGKGVALSIPFTSVIGKQVFGFLTNDERTVKENGNGRN